MKNNTIYDKDFRAKLMKDPKQYLQQIYNNKMDANIEYVVVTCSQDITYIAMPSKDSFDIKELTDIAAAGTVSTASTSGTASSLTLTVSTATTLGTAGSVNLNVNNDVKI